MAMDLTKDCPHCNAPRGQMCEETCKVNGEKAKNLKAALAVLGLYLGKNWREIKSYSEKRG